MRGKELVRNILCEKAAIERNERKKLIFELNSKVGREIITKEYIIIF